MNTITNNYDNNKQYKFGCVIPYYNRKSLVEQTFQSINNSCIPNDLLFVLIDDGSDQEIKPDIQHDHILITKDKNYGISNSLSIGWDIIYSLNIRNMLNIDSDAEVSPNWISTLNNIFQSYNKNYDNVDCIITGYNGSFPDGITNHPCIKETKHYRIKKSVGGINLFFDRNIYQSIVRKAITSYNIIPSTIDDVIFSIDLYGSSSPRLNPKENKKIGWDWGLSYLCEQNNIQILSAKKSVVQHKGLSGISSRSTYFEQSYDYENQSIPKIIHQLWKDDYLPYHLFMMQKSVKYYHSDYNYMFWTDSSLDQFIKKNYPGIWDFYNSGIEYIIQKIDFVRLLLIYHYGGVYIDLDSLCIKNMDYLLNYPCSLINTKKHESFSDKHYPLIINNAFIASEPRNDFIKHIMLNIINYKDPPNYKEYCSFNPLYTKILKSCGPLGITDSYLSYQDKSFIKLLPNNYYYGLDYPKDMSQSEIIQYGLDTSLFIEDCYFMHMHESSWWRINGKAMNPILNSNFDSKNLDDKKTKAILELVCFY
jgi:mannosyltransferase OCH1-like enzyme